MENLSVTLACLGNNSVMSKPGTFVRVGFQMPRYSAGASGFMSYISMWPGPPSSQIRITDEFLLLVGDCADAAFARRISGRLREAMPAMPSCKKLRRE